MTLRSIAAALAMSFVVSAACARMHSAPDDTRQPVDRIEVFKADRKMLLLHGTQVVRIYHVRLGLNPIGPKQRSGDYRTPEGTYYLEGHNPRSDYFLSIRVSYPNHEDLQRARSRHWDAGNSIMIHGVPNALRHRLEYYKSHDWTDGCIALSNADMAEFWTLAPYHVRIDIRP